MSEHQLDLVSLVAGVVLLALGVTGLLRAAGWVDGSALYWAGVGIVAVFGLVGAVASLRGLLQTANGSPREQA